MQGELRQLKFQCKLDDWTNDNIRSSTRCIPKLTGENNLIKELFINPKFIPLICFNISIKLSGVAAGEGGGRLMGTRTPTVIDPPIYKG